MNRSSPRLAAALIVTSVVSAIVGLVCLRLVLVLDFIDPQTGFYRVATLSAAVFPYLYAAFLAALFVFVLRYRSSFSASSPGALRIAAPAASTLGACLLIPQVVTAVTLLRGLKESMRQPLDLLFSIFALLVCCCAGAAFLLLSLKLLTNGVEPIFTHSIVLALPILWRCFLLVGRFVAKPAPAALSESTLGILLDLFAVLFMVAHARVITQLGLKDGTRMLLFSGCAYTLTALLLFIPWLATIIWGSTTLDPMLAMRWLPDIALALYSVVCVIAIRKQGRAGASPA